MRLRNAVAVKDLKFVQTLQIYAGIRSLRDHELDE